MRLWKVFRLMLFGAFFLWLHFWLRFSFGNVADPGGACNQGGPFGVSLPLWLIFATGMVGIVAFSCLWWRENTLKSEWPWILILSGGMGNLLERMLFGCIMDYIALPLFPVFNLADALLTFGVIGILMENVKIKMKNDSVK